MKYRVVADARFDALGYESVGLSAHSCRDWVAAALDAGVEAAVVVGDDATLAALGTAYVEATSHRSEPLWFAPVASGQLATVAAGLETVGASKKAIDKLCRRIQNGDARRTAISTLRVVDSSSPSARIAFNFGMGAFTRLVDPKGRVRRRDALRDALVSDELVDADVRIDWNPATERLGYLIASSLDVSWARVKMGGPASIRFGTSAMELLRGATKVGRLLERATGGAAAPFGRVHIDSMTDYVVDGQVVRSDRPRMIEVTPGAQLRILV